MVKEFIRKNMLHGGYSLVSARLKARELIVTNQQILNEIRGLSNNNNVAIIYECLIFMKENSIRLDEYGQQFLDSYEKRKEPTTAPSR